ncbi:hypothetical protein BD770DRAFT_414833 [Pilaira anomala]|nr:hypothetical protein BD770DRAFT_414833 [Pilaira anomala]
MTNKGQSRFFCSYLLHITLRTYRKHRNRIGNHLLSDQKSATLFSYDKKDHFIMQEILTRQLVYKKAIFVYSWQLITVSTHIQIILQKCNIKNDLYALLKLSPERTEKKKVRTFKIWLVRLNPYYVLSSELCCYLIVYLGRNEQQKK